MCSRPRPFYLYSVVFFLPRVRRLRVPRLAAILRFRALFRPSSHRRSVYILLQMYRLSSFPSEPLIFVMGLMVCAGLTLSLGVGVFRG